jgi:hypothetical protein
MTNTWQDRQLTYKVILGRVRVSIVAMEKISITHSLFVCVRMCVVFVFQRAKRYMA